MRVVGYVRVSTSEQAEEGFSLDAQEERLKAYAKAQGWSLGQIYRDEGHSGRTIKRPGYQAMMAEIPNWDLVLVVKMDRIHRNTRNFIDLMDTLAKQKKEFASVTESFDTSTAMGRFFRDLLQRLAQLESEVIGERVLVGMTQKARSKGGSLGGRAPLGYVRPSDGALLEVDLSCPHLPAIAKAFRQAANPFVPASYAEIGARTGFDRFQVRRILTNPTYAGCTVWNGIVQEGTHKAIVDVKTFREVQKRFKTGVVI